MTLLNWIRKNASTILTVLGAGGMVCTVALAIDATPKAMAKLKAARNHKREIEEAPSANLTAMETVMICGKDYIPMAATGVATLVCIFGANALNHRQQAAIASAYAALESAYQGYRTKVRQIIGEGADRMVEESVKEEARDAEDDRPPWDEVQTFYIDHYGKFFEATMEQVVKAEYHLNRNFALRGYVTLNEFFEFLNLDPTEDGDRLGWDDYSGQAFYGYGWIDFDHRRYITDDGLAVCAIDMPFGPHSIDEGDPGLELDDCVQTCGIE